MNENVFSLGALLWQIFNLIVLLAVFVFLGWRVWRVIKRRIKAAKRVETSVASLAESIRTHRQRCKMTQEFVAETLGVSRQAVSKWESGAAVPSTANLMALAKLFEADAAQWVKSCK